MPQWIIWRVIVPALDAPSRDLILPECKSILVLALPYGNPKTAPVKASVNAAEGQIASYAWGNDYHLVIAERLQALVAFIEERVGHPIPNRWYTDTGPILRKRFSPARGLGMDRQEYLSY